MQKINLNLNLNCSLNSDICRRRRAVYKIVCEKCNEYCIGSTIRYIHERISEHLKHNTSSVFKHLKKCGNKNNKIDVSIIDAESDPVNLRLLEAVYIKKLQPSLNSRDEAKELCNLLFWTVCLYIFHLYTYLDILFKSFRYSFFTILTYIYLCIRSCFIYYFYASMFHTILYSSFHHTLFYTLGTFLFLYICHFYA